MQSEQTSRASFSADKEGQGRADFSADKEGQGRADFSANKEGQGRADFSANKEGQGRADFSADKEEQGGGSRFIFAKKHRSKAFLCSDEVQIKRLWNKPIALRHIFDSSSSPSAAYL